MKITREKALQKLREDYSKEDTGTLVDLLLDFHKKLNDTELKMFLEDKYDVFVIIEEEEKPIDN